MFSLMSAGLQSHFVYVQESLGVLDDLISITNVR